MRLIALLALSFILAGGSAYAQENPVSMGVK